MTDASQEQRSEREMQQQKWHKFADQLRHSLDTEHNTERVYDEKPSAFVADPSSNGLKSPISDEQQSDLGTDQTVDESSSGVAEDGFEVVTSKRNRNQRSKPLNGNVWSGAATHLKELHSTSSSSSTNAHSGNSSTQSSKLRVATANNTASNPKRNAQNRNLTAKNTQSLTRSAEDGVPDIEQDTSNSNSSDSAFAENQSPHGSSASLHFIASENQNFSDAMGLSDEEKWPELSVGTTHTQSIKPTASPTSPKELEAKSTTPVEEKTNSLEKDTTSSNKRTKAGQWKRMEVEIVYTKPNEKKHGSSKRNYRSHGNSEHESGHRHSVGSSYKRRPQSRKSNVSSSDVESQNNNDNKKAESKIESNESSEHAKTESHRQVQSTENAQVRRDNKPGDQNNRNHRNNNAHRQDQQPHYNDYNRRQQRNPRVRHSVPNLFHCQNAVPIYFLSQDYAPENFIQPLASSQAAPPFIYPNVGNVLVPTGYPDMSYANAQFLNEYGQQNMFQYRAPFVQMPVLSQNPPFVNTTIPTTIPESVAEQSPTESHNNGVVTEQTLEEELSHLLRRVFGENSESKSLRDLTDNMNIISQLNYPERCLILRCQIRYYFSPDNLAKDLFLRSHMDDEGFVPLGLFLTFPRIKNLALDSNTIVNSLATSPNFELRINEHEVKIRAKTIVPQEWVPANNLNNSTTPSTTVPSPQADSAASISQTKRPSQAPDEVSVDDIRARLINAKSKHSPASSEHPNETTPKSESPVSQRGEEVEDQWVVCKKKTRQPSANGTMQHEAENHIASKPPSGKRATRQ